MKSREKTGIRENSIIKPIWDTAILIQQCIAVYEGTGSFCLSSLPSVMLDLHKIGCLHDSKMLNSQAFMGASHRQIRRGNSSLESSKRIRFLSQKSQPNSPCVSLALKYILRPFLKQGLIRVMSELLDLNLDNRISFKNKGMVLPWLTPSVSFPGSRSVYLYLCSMTIAYFMCLTT